MLDMVSKTKKSEAVPHVGGAKRLDYIDVAKGVGILLVVIGHLISPQLLVNGWIQNFHMPLFFIISGMLYKPSRYPTFMEYAKRKSRVLLKPLVVFILLNLLLTYLLRLDYYTIAVLSSPKFPNAMWFVWVLLLTELIFYPLTKMSKCGMGILTAASFLFSLELHRKGCLLPLNILSVTPAIGFYGLGYMGKNVCVCFYNSRNKSGLLLAAVMLSLPLMMALVFSERFSLMDNLIPKPPMLSIISASLASVGLIKLCTYIHWRWLKRMLVFWGKTSITTLSLHVCFLNIAMTYFSIQSHAIYKVAEFTFVLTMSAMTSYIMERYGKALIR